MSLPINIELPEGFLNDEVRCGYTINHKMKKVWAVELDLLAEFQKVCAKYDIKYMASGGTMLGAVRHNGYIPWDDDIDLYVLRDDYNKLEEIMSKELQEPYFWQTENTDRGTVRGHAQLRNSETTAILMTEKDLKLAFNQGIFIDIFPVDRVPDKELKRKFFFSKLKMFKKLGHIYALETLRPIKKGTNHYCFKIILKFFLFPFAKLTNSKNYFYSFFEKEASMYNSKRTKHIGEIVLNPGNGEIVFDSSTFENLTLEQFEFMNVSIPKMYDEFLTNQYGNWREMKRTSTIHGEVLFDTDKSYRENIY